MIVSMACNWLASAELPSGFWFYTFHRAAEVCNYFPYKLEDGTSTTPCELVHHTKPDLRILFKMFGLAAVQWEHIGDNTLPKPIIAAGHCPHSNGIQFYDSVNGMFVSSIDYSSNLIQPVVLILVTSINPVFSFIDLMKQHQYLYQNWHLTLLFWFIHILPLIKQK
jgi:hypothetical protein